MACSHLCTLRTVLVNSHSPGGAIVCCDGSRNGVVDMSVRKSQIHLHKEGFTSMGLRFWSSICGWIVLNALEKSKKIIRAEGLGVYPGVSGQVNKYDNCIFGTPVSPVGKLMSILKL